MPLGASARRAQPQQLLELRHEVLADRLADRLLVTLHEIGFVDRPPCLLGHLAGERGRIDDVDATGVEAYRSAPGCTFATILAREPDGFDEGGGFLKSCRQDPVLSSVKLIADTTRST